jgi:hypothetical protein
MATTAIPSTAESTTAIGDGAEELAEDGSTATTGSTFTTSTASSPSTASAAAS